MKIHETWALYSPDFWVCGVAWYWRAGWAVFGPIGLLVIERLLACLATIEGFQGVQRLQRALRKTVLVELGIVGVVVVVTFARVRLLHTGYPYPDDSILFEWAVRLMILAAPAVVGVAFAKDSAASARLSFAGERALQWLSAAAILAAVRIGPPPVAILFVAVWPPVWTDACLVEMMVMTSDPEDQVVRPGEQLAHLEFSTSAAKRALRDRQADAQVVDFACRLRVGEGRYLEGGSIRYRPARHLFQSMGRTDAAIDELAAWAREHPDYAVRDVAHEELSRAIAGQKNAQGEALRKEQQKRESRRAPPEPSGSAPSATPDTPRSP